MFHTRHGNRKIKTGHLNFQIRPPGKYPPIYRNIARTRNGKQMVGMSALGSGSTDWARWLQVRFGSNSVA